MTARSGINKKTTIDRALEHFSDTHQKQHSSGLIPFDDYLKQVTDYPERSIRNIFQLFHDMIKNYVEPGVDEYQEDPESINYSLYDTSRLFVDGSDNPFFADRLFSNRLVKLAESFRHGARQNKIYIFKGPHGSGKSTFLNNLLSKFEQFANSDQGCTFEAVWKLDRELLQDSSQSADNAFLQRLSVLLDEYELGQNSLSEVQRDLINRGAGSIDIPCPSHDSPILMIPREQRRDFFDDLFKNDEAKWKLFTEKQYEWLFKDTPCTICSSIYEALLKRLHDPKLVLEKLYARHYRYSRRLGEGISVYSPGDKILKQSILSNDMLQQRINTLLHDSNQVRYLFSHLAKTNNGIYALMDIKGNNVERLLALHNIISEGVHKVEDIEEQVSSLFLALMNPEDEESIKDLPSLSDRIEPIKIPYVLDLCTEVEIYRNTFGRQINDLFLPRVLHNFARIIISTRMKTHSAAMHEWIGDPTRYSRYCDKNLQLLKMEIYTGNIPAWLNEQDRKGLTSRLRSKIIAESEQEGTEGLSGRDSIDIFEELLAAHGKEGSMVDMATLGRFFSKNEQIAQMIPEGFLDALLQMYNYTIMQEIKESLYNYNEDQIIHDLQNYIFATNFEEGLQIDSPYSGDRILVGEEFFIPIEKRLLETDADQKTALAFRADVQKAFTSQALTQEIQVGNKNLTDTALYRKLYERYVYHLKEKVLQPFLSNDNFRRAIKDFGREGFKTYDDRIRNDVSFLINNLISKFGYSKRGAQEVCIYMIDNTLTEEITPRKTSSEENKSAFVVS